MSCQKAQGFLEENQIEVKDTANAGKERKGRAEALALARQASRVVAARGKNVVVFDMKKAPPDDDLLAAHLLGPTGNLRAPTLRVGNTLLVGFSEQTYQDWLNS